MVSWDGMNRRKFPRVIYPCLVVVRTDHDQQDALLAHTENVGIGGLCVILRRELKLFSPVDIQLDLLDMGEHIKCKGKVVWVIRRKATESTKPMFYDVGIEFVDMPDSDHQRIENVLRRLVRPVRV